MMNLNTQQPIVLEMARPRNITYQRVKRVGDVVFSSLILVLISPLLLAISLLILILDGGPVLFKQQRVGLNNKPFVIWKFRTMKPAHKQVAAAAQNGNTSNEYEGWDNGVPDNFVFKSGFNPNVTRLGEFLRKYSLDELPQFINVFKGDMSIIGPRPEVPQITRYYNAIQRQRLLVKPGITGYAQVNGRSLIPHGEKIKHDLYYVNNSSMWLDCKIFLKTIGMVLLRKGAF